MNYQKTYEKQMQQILKIKNTCKDLLQLSTELQKIRESARNWYVDAKVYNEEYFDRMIHEYKTELKSLIKFIS